VRVRRAGIALGMAAIALGTTACASPKSSEPISAHQEVRDASAGDRRGTRSGTRSGARRAAPITTPSPEAVVGGGLTLAGRSGETASVRVQQIVDPAQGGDPLAIPQVGMRFVGVELVVSAPNGPVSADVNAGTVLVGTDGRTYLHDDDPIAGCAAIPMGQVAISAGSTVTGCVTFEVPDTVGISAVEFTLAHGGESGRWQVG